MLIHQFRCHNDNYVFRLFITEDVFYDKKACFL